MRHVPLESSHRPCDRRPLAETSANGTVPCRLEDDKWLGAMSRAGVTHPMENVYGDITHSINLFGRKLSPPRYRVRKN